MTESFCGNFQFVIDIWQGSDAFELAYVSYYKGFRLSLTRIFDFCEYFRKLMAVPRQLYA